jgi:hypothetical protein
MGRCSLDLDRGAGEVRAPVGPLSGTQRSRWDLSKPTGTGASIVWEDTLSSDHIRLRGRSAQVDFDVQNVGSPCGVCFR